MSSSDDLVRTIAEQYREAKNREENASSEDALPEPIADLSNSDSDVDDAGVLPLFLQKEADDRPDDWGYDLDQSLVQPKAVSDRKTEASVLAIGRLNAFPLLPTHPAPEDMGRLEASEEIVDVDAGHLEEYPLRLKPGQRIRVRFPLDEPFRNLALLLQMSGPRRSPKPPLQWAVDKDTRKLRVSFNARVIYHQWLPGNLFAVRSFLPAQWQRTLNTLVIENVGKETLVTDGLLVTDLKPGPQIALGLTAGEAMPTVMARQVRFQLIDTPIQLPEWEGPASESPPGDLLPRPSRIKSAAAIWNEWRQGRAEGELDSFLQGMLEDIIPVLQFGIDPVLRIRLPAGLEEAKASAETLRALADLLAPYVQYWSFEPNSRGEELEAVCKSWEEILHLAAPHAVLLWEGETPTPRGFIPLVRVAYPSRERPETCASLAMIKGLQAGSLPTHNAAMWASISRCISSRSLGQQARDILLAAESALQWWFCGGSGAIFENGGPGGRFLPSAGVKPWATWEAFRFLAPIAVGDAQRIPVLLVAKPKDLALSDCFYVAARNGPEDVTFLAYSRRDVGAPVRVSCLVPWNGPTKARVIRARPETKPGSGIAVVRWEETLSVAAHPTGDGGLVTLDLKLDRMNRVELRPRRKKLPHPAAWRNRLAAASGSASGHEKQRGRGAFRVSGKREGFLHSYLRSARDTNWHYEICSPYYKVRKAEATQGVIEKQKLVVPWADESLFITAAFPEDRADYYGGVAFWLDPGSSFDAASFWVRPQAKVGIRDVRLIARAGRGAGAIVTSVRLKVGKWQRVQLTRPILQEEGDRQDNTRAKLPSRIELEANPHDRCLRKGKEIVFEVQGFVVMARDNITDKGKLAAPLRIRKRHDSGKGRLVWMLEGVPGHASVLYHAFETAVQIKAVSLDGKTIPGSEWKYLDAPQLCAFRFDAGTFEIGEDEGKRSKIRRLEVEYGG